jgi:PKD repeat protein
VIGTVAAMNLHMTPRLRRRSRFTAAASLLLLAGLGAGAPAASATTPTAVYHEAARFGSFDATTYDNGHYDGSPTPTIGGPVKILDATGFAVDPADASGGAQGAVYILDRTSLVVGTGSPALSSWRLQKVDDQGHVLGYTTFTLPANRFTGVGMEGLVVDHADGLVFAMIDGQPGSKDDGVTASLTAPALQEIVAWSTAPNSSGKLVAPTKYPTADPNGSTGGVVSTTAQLEPGGTNDLVYQPEGFALDHTASGTFLAVADVVEAPTMVTAGISQVSIDTGAVTSNSWVATSLSSLPGTPIPANQAISPVGLSTNADGSLTALLGIRNSNGQIDAVKLGADLAASPSPAVLIGTADLPDNQDLDEASYEQIGNPFANSGGAAVAAPFTAASQIVGLSQPGANTSNGLYASAYAQDGNAAGDIQTSDLAPFYFKSGAPNTVPAYTANYGVRLLGSTAAGRISDPLGGTILDTLANGTAGGPCSLPANLPALAAGGGGAVWVINRGQDASISTLGRSIVELAPGGGTATDCPQPSGTFAMSDTAGPVSDGATIPAATKVTFDGSTLNDANGNPFAYDWEGTPAGGGNALFSIVNQITPGFETGFGGDAQPSPTASFTFNAGGTYTITLNYRSDYGVYTTHQTVVVQGNGGGTPPTASFTPPVGGGTVGAPAQFDASASKPSPGSTIADYQWNWGDHTAVEDDNGPIDSHSYAAAGTYPVSLTVKDKNGLSATQTANVTIAPAPPPPPCTTCSTSTSSSTSTSTSGSQSVQGVSDTTKTLLSPQAKASGYTVSVTLHCPAVKKLCAGTVQLQTVNAFAAAAKSKSKAKPKPAKVVLGQVSFSLQGGQSKTIKITITGRGATLVKQLKHLPIHVTVTAHDSVGNPGTQVVTVNVSPPPPPKKPGKKK